MEAHGAAVTPDSTTHSPAAIANDDAGARYAVREKLQMREAIVSGRTQNTR